MQKYFFSDLTDISPNREWSDEIKKIQRVVLLHKDKKGKVMNQVLNKSMLRYRAHMNINMSNNNDK